MDSSGHTRKEQIKTVATIISRNVFILINAIIFAVVVLLTLFGDTQEGIFLGIITLWNILIGCTQEINSWRALEKLQLLAVPRVTRLNRDGSEEVILINDIKVGDRLKLKVGDQVPCDGVVSATFGFEVNEALITGESKSFERKEGEQVFAGSIVTSGEGVIDVQKTFAESRIALMTKSIKKYSLILSPIQKSINTIIKYTSYTLLLVIAFVVSRGFFIHESTVNIVQNIGALTSTLLPQGMVVIITLLFSYGAAHMYKRNVLLQEINATEKIGRIKNLCMDKTGTLTNNKISIEHMHIPEGVNDKSVEADVSAYIKGTKDMSQTITAIKEMFTGEYLGEIKGVSTFSSARQFGAVHIEDEFGERVIVAGAPDILFNYLMSDSDKEWLQAYIEKDASVGKRLICFTRADKNILPHKLEGIALTAVSVFILNNELREGVKEAVSFFQDRGVTIRIISGDSPATVQSVAISAGIHGCESVVSGADLEKWTDDDFSKKAKLHTIFARIKPEQKEKIIMALKEDGFTAMIGDGANDALAIKKADLGIAMFDGAQATRQLASVVLVKNSFTDLPNGVRLADSIIQNIEICAAIFFNQVFLGLFFFAALTLFGFSFPFTPLNITFINYFTVGLPGFLIFYWIIRPIHAKIARDNRSFLRQVIPFAVVSAIPQAIVAVFAFYSSLEHIQTRGPTSLVVLSFIALGVIFFMFTPSVYSGPTTRKQKKQFVLLFIIEVISVVFFIKIPIVAAFYNLKAPSLHSVLELVPILLLYAAVQYFMTRWFFRIKPPAHNKV